MVTMVATSTTMSWATATITRTSQRWSLGAGRWPPAAEDTDDMVAIPPGEKRGWFGQRWLRTARRSCRGHLQAGCSGRGGQRPGRIVEGVEQAEQGGQVLLAQGAEDLLEQPLARGVRHAQAGSARVGDGDELGPAVRGVRAALGQALAFKRVDDVGDRGRGQPEA